MGLNGLGVLSSSCVSLELDICGILWATARPMAKWREPSAPSKILCKRRWQ